MTEAKLRDSGTAKGGDAQLARWFLASPKNSSEKCTFFCFDFFVQAKKMKK